MKTLKDYLQTQDLGEIAVNSICNNVLNSENTVENDPISQIIVNAFVNNENGTCLDDMWSDLNHAREMINRVCKMVDEQIV